MKGISMINGKGISLMLLAMTIALAGFTVDSSTDQCLIALNYPYHCGIVPIPTGCNEIRNLSSMQNDTGNKKECCSQIEQNTERTSSCSIKFVRTSSHSCSCSFSAESSVLPGSTIVLDELKSYFIVSHKTLTPSTEFYSDSITLQSPNPRNQEIPQPLRI